MTQIIHMRSSQSAFKQVAVYSLEIIIIKALEIEQYSSAVIGMTVLLLVCSLGFCTTFSVLRTSILVLGFRIALKGVSMGVFPQWEYKVLRGCAVQFSCVRLSSSAVIGITVLMLVCSIGIWTTISVIRTSILVLGFLWSSTAQSLPLGKKWLLRE